MIEDIDDDQGRQVNISWYRSMHDSSGSSQPIFRYYIYRRIDDLPSPPFTYLTEGDSPENSLENRDVADFPEGDWDFMTGVDALGEDLYSIVVPTLEDSCVYNDSTTAGDPLYYSTFFIKASSLAPVTEYYSAPDSGYSVDNLAPSTPTGVTITEGEILQWDDNEEPDLGGYCLYARIEESSESVRLGVVHESEWDVTHSIIYGGYHHWGVSAFDINGNESPAEEIAWIPTDSEEPLMPRADYLSQNYPNPFNPRTTIYFGLKSPYDVSLRVYDVSGRVVRVLADGHFGAGEYCRIWDGRTSTGAMAASGVYFYKLVTGEFAETKKMILLK